MALRRARLTITMREVAGTQASVLASPGQSALSLHHRPLSAHILAGWPSAQKSPASIPAHEVSLDEVQVVLAVTTPCLHEPHGLPELPMQYSLRKRPERSLLEMKRQKSPLTVLHSPSEEQGVPLLSLQ